MPELAKYVQVRARESLKIDGEEFPWHVIEGGISWDASEPTTLTITIFAERIDIVDDSRSGVECRDG